MSPKYAISHCLLLMVLAMTFALISTSVLVGCGPTPPIVANPIEPWEEEATRGMMRPLTPTPHAHVERRDLEEEDVESRPEHRPPLVTALADIIGFPFRGVAWLAHVLL